MKARAGRWVTVIAFLASVMVHLGLGTAGIYLFMSRRALFQGSVSVLGEARLISVGLLTESSPSALEKRISASVESPPANPEDKAELSFFEEPVEDRAAVEPAPITIAGEGGGDPLSSEEEYDRYLNRLREKIVAAAFYPPLARSRGWHGGVRLGFSVDHSGRLLGVELIEPSRHPSLNRAAMAIVRNAAPFPEPDLKLAGKNIALTIDFRLER